MSKENAFSEGGIITRIRSGADRIIVATCEDWSRFSDSEKAIALGASAATFLAIYSLLDPGLKGKTILSVAAEDGFVVTGTLFALNLLKISFKQLIPLAVNVLQAINRKTP